MRIFHVVATDQEWGGLERSVVELANLQKNTHQIKVGAAPVVLDRLPADVDRVVLPMRLSRRDPRLLWKLGRALRDFKPDVIHVHANKAAALINTLRPWLPRAATIATVQNTKRSVNVFRRYDRVIAVSRKAGASLGQIPHTVIWNAIPRSQPSTDLSSPLPPFLNQGRPVIAAVGRLVSAKGFDILLEALRSVEACLWIVGDGPLRAELEAQATAAGVADRVWFSGFRRDVNRLMALADLMVISSRHEGFPFVFVELMQLRRPVVSTRVAGVEEVLPPEWLCEPDDASGLAALIRKALARGNELAVDQAGIFDFAARELSLDHTLPRIEAIYHEAIDAHLSEPAMRQPRDPVPGSIVVKFITKHYGRDRSPIWLRMIPGSDGRWGACTFVPGPSLNRYDWLVVYDDWSAPKSGGAEILRCSPEHTLLVTNEPASVKLYEPEFTRQFRHVLTSQEPRHLSHPGRIYSPSTLLWYYGQQAPFVRDYDTLTAASSPEKTDDISTVCSSKQQRHTLHYQRYQFTQALKQSTPELAIFGHGVRPIIDKVEAIDPFRYHVAIENHVAPHHWTEKLADVFLGGALPFYYGCPNLADYFPPDSFIRIDIHDPVQAHRIIRRAMADGAYEKRLPAIQEARRRVLERYNLFALLETIIREHHQPDRPSAPPGLRLFNRKAIRRRHPFLAVPFLLKKGVTQLSGRLLRTRRHPVEG